MAIAKNLDLYPKAWSGNSSFYRYAHAEYFKEDGKTKKRLRLIYDAVDIKKPEYISTYVENKDGTKTVVSMTFDLDLSRAHSKWIIVDNSGLRRLDYDAIISFLREKHPEVMKWLLHACKSTSGTGLCLEFAVSPLTIHERDTPEAAKTFNCERLYRRVNLWLYELISFYGMGCDPGAIGIGRIGMNWNNPKFHLFTNEVLHRKVWQRQHRENILRQLFDYLGDLEIIKAGERERWHNEAFELKDLYPNARVRKKLAQLIIDVYEDGCRKSVSYHSLEKQYGLSKYFIYNVLKPNNFPERLGIFVDSKGRGDWSLALDVSSPAISLAFEALATPDKKKGSKGFLCTPEMVSDGERYRWLGMAIVYLKVAGYSLEEAYRRMLTVVKRIPEYQHSRNCSPGEILCKVRAIYRSGVKELRPELLPQFLREEEVAVVSPVSHKNKKSFLEKTKKVMGAALDHSGLEQDDLLGELEVVPISCPKEKILKNSLKGSGENPTGLNGIEDLKQQFENGICDGVGKGPSRARVSFEDGLTLVTSEVNRELSTIILGKGRSYWGLLDSIVSLSSEERLELLIRLRAKGEPVALEQETPTNPWKPVVLRSDTPVPAVTPPEADAFQPPKRANGCNIHEQRKRDFFKVDLQERFFKDLIRCRASRTEIYDELVRAHRAELNGRKRCHNKNNPFRRVVRSFQMISDTWRRNFLESFTAPDESIRLERFAAEIERSRASDTELESILKKVHRELCQGKPARVNQEHSLRFRGVKKAFKVLGERTRTDFLEGLAADNDKGL